MALALDGCSLAAIKVDLSVTIDALGFGSAPASGQQPPRDGPAGFSPRSHCSGRKSELHGRRSLRQFILTGEDDDGIDGWRGFAQRLAEQRLGARVDGLNVQPKGVLLGQDRVLECSEPQALSNRRGCVRHVGFPIVDLSALGHRARKLWAHLSDHGQTLRGQFGTSMAPA